MSLGLCRCRRVSLGLCRCRPSRRLGRRRSASPNGKGQVDACDVEQNTLGLLGQHLGDLGRIHHHGPQLILLVELLRMGKMYLPLEKWASSSSCSSRLSWLIC